jgi:AhpC/TSA family
VPGLLYADNHRDWEEWLGVHERPATVLLDPTGKQVWRHHGHIEAGALGDALRWNLVTARQLYPHFAACALQPGQRPPNFVFAFRGQELTLRKLAGKSLSLVFLRAGSSPGIETIRNLRHAGSQPGVHGLTIVAIQDGSSDGSVSFDDVIVIPDPEREISQAYGVSIWPTVVFVDAEGSVREVRSGGISTRDLKLQVSSRSTRTNSEEEC